MWGGESSLWQQRLLFSSQRILSRKVLFPYLHLCLNNPAFLLHLSLFPTHANRAKADTHTRGIIGFFYPVWQPAGLCWWWLEFVRVPGEAWPPTGIQRRPKATGTASSAATALVPPCIHPSLLPLFSGTPNTASQSWQHEMGAAECEASSMAHIRVTHSSWPRACISGLFICRLTVGSCSIWR